MKHKILLFILLLLGTSGVHADEPVRFSASAPSTVIIDKPFQLVYSVNATGKDLKVADLNNFEILAGPFESRSSSYQIVNGKTSSSISISYTYTLQAPKTGTFTIPSASIIVDGTKYTSNGLSIKVLPDDESSAAKANQKPQSGSTASSQSISNDNVFIRTSVSKANVYEQEGILITYKLYTLVDVVSVNNKKMPDFNGFLKQDMEQNQNKQFSYENYNGKNYGTVVLYQVLLYPQHDGEILIDKANFEAVIRVQNRTAVRSIFDDFFDSYTNVSKDIIAPATKIIVKALPLSGKPAGYNGTVGNFALNSTISSQQVKTNEAVTLKISISGSGNMKLIKNPELKFPDGFEVYDPKANNNFKTTTAGITGTKSVEFMFIPRHPGKYEIPSAEFSYFDTKDKTYKVLRTPTYKLNVLKGDGNESATVVSNYANKEDVKQLGKDIRYIVTDEIKLKKVDESIFGTTLAWLLYIVPILVSLILFILFRKNVKDNANVEFVKNKKANRIATKRLKLALKLLNEGKKDIFYEEVLKSVWTYLSDKLSIPVSNLNKTNVETELDKKGVTSETTQKVLQVLNTCEFARYAPNSGQQEMGNLYEETIEVISKLEETIKKL
ncbi:MAG TPA: BatD family protein [Paludibacter sp.]|nr:BatD family protein [Paludibacter sp.]